MGSTRITYREADEDTQNDLDSSLQTSVDLISAVQPLLQPTQPYGLGFKQMNYSIGISS